MPERITLDPITEDAANAPFELICGDDDQILGLVAHAYPAPQQDLQTASSVDTEGELPVSRRYHNRQIPISVEIAADPGLPAATNKATNPKSLIDTTGWTNNSLTLFERQTTLPARLDPFDTAIHATANADDDAAYLTAAVTNGVAETFTAWVYVVSGAVRLEVWNATPALSVNSANITTGSWQKIVLPYTPNATANWTFRIAQNGAGTSEFYVTGAQIGPGYPYFDGDTAGCSWAGTRHASSSSRAAAAPRAAAALVQLEAKIAKIAREGGTLRRVLSTGETITFDLVTADTYEPTFDQAYHLGGLTAVSFSLQAKPIGRGAPITLSTHTATANAPLIFTETGVKGDLPAAGTLTISNVSNDKLWAVWGQQSRYYSAAAGAGLLLEAESCALAAATAAVGPAGASGAGTNKVAQHLNVGTVGSTSINLSATGSTLDPPQHVGTFRVFARVQADSANTGIPSIQFAWQRDLMAPQTFNDWVPVVNISGTAIKGSWVLLDLGLVSLPKARIGLQGWTGALAAKSTVSTDDVYYDWIALVPADEGDGEVFVTSSPISATGKLQITDLGVQISDSLVAAWGDVKYEGSYLGAKTGVPPAGAEGRTLRMFVLLAGDFDITSTLVSAAHIDAISAQLTYRPRYLVVPAS